MNRLLIVFLTWLVAMAIQPAISTAKMVDGIVAVINNDILLYSELEEEWHRLLHAKPSVAEEPPQEQAKMKRQLLQQMVRDRLTAQEAERLKIKVSSQEIDRAIAGIKKENGLSDQQLEAILGQEGSTMDQFREKVRQEILRNRLIDRIFESKTVITDEQIDAYLKTHSSGKERKRLAVITLPVTAGMSADQVEVLRKQAEDIYTRLKGGEDFAKLASKYSKGPGADEGGDIGFIAISDLAQPLEEATRNLNAGQYTQVLQTKGGFYILKILAVKNEDSGTPTDQQARERASRELMRVEINRKFEKWMKDLEEKSYVHINYDMLTKN